MARAGAAATAEAVAARALEVAVALVQVDSVVSAAPGEAWAVGSKAVAAEWAASGSVYEHTRDETMADEATSDEEWEEPLRATRLQHADEVKKCAWCKQELSTSEYFTKNPKTNAWYSKCEDCRPLHLKTSHTSVNNAENQRRSVAKYRASEHGKVAVQLYKQSEAAKAASKRARKHRTDRCRASSAMRMDNTIRHASHHLLSRRIKTSPTFVERTSFASVQEFLDAVEATFLNVPGASWKNFGTVWQLDHKIPREAYDFNNPEDIKRCWSAKNVHAMTPQANMEKKWKLEDQYISEAGVECYPVAWNGKAPDEAFKKRHADKIMAPNSVEAGTSAEAGPSAE